MNEYKIRKANGGFIVDDTSTVREKVFTRLEDVFEDMLLHFEGRARTFSGSSYGSVEITRH